MKKSKLVGLKEIAARRDRLIKQRDLLDQRINAYNLVLSEWTGKHGKRAEKEAASPLPLFGPENVGRQNSIISLAWDTVKDERGMFGVKDVRPKLEALGRKTRSTIISATLKRLCEKQKLVQVKPGKNRWNPAQYAVKR